MIILKTVNKLVDVVTMIANCSLIQMLLLFLQFAIVREGFGFEI